MSKKQKTFFVLLHNQRTSFFIKLAAFLASVRGHRVILYANRHVTLPKQESAKNRIEIRSLRYNQLFDFASNTKALNPTISLSNVEKKIGLPFKRVLLTDERKVGVSFRNNTWLWFRSSLTTKILTARARH